MNISETPIPGLLIIQPVVFKDSRGYFFESYNKSKLSELGFNWEFVQDNISVSSRNTLRGLHYQLPPFSQGKLVSVIKGAVLDVALDIRKDSEFFCKYFSVKLSAENNTMFWIPPGFAHGFLALEDETVFSYKCTNVYNKSSERSIFWNDPQINIDWEVENPLLSDKDLVAPLLKEVNELF